MIKTWQQRCEEHPEHEGIVTEQMIRDRMQEEIDELRQALSVPEKPDNWVGLTDADIAKAMQGSVEGSNMLPYQFARAIEEKLKEKNA